MLNGSAGRGQALVAATAPVPTKARVSRRAARSTLFIASFVGATWARAFSSSATCFGFPPAVRVKLSVTVPPARTVPPLSAGA